MLPTEVRVLLPRPRLAVAVTVLVRVTAVSMRRIEVAAAVALVRAAVVSGLAVVAVGFCVIVATMVICCDVRGSWEILFDYSEMRYIL